jgi:hypothetical protein
MTAADPASRQERVGTWLPAPLGAVQQPRHLGVRIAEAESVCQRNWKLPRSLEEETCRREVCNRITGGRPLHSQQPRRAVNQDRSAVFSSKYLNRAPRRTRAGQRAGASQAGLLPGPTDHGFVLEGANAINARRDLGQDFRFYSDRASINFCDRTTIENRAHAHAFPSRRLAIAPTDRCILQKGGTDWMTAQLAQWLHFIVGASPKCRERTVRLLRGRTRD